MRRNMHAVICCFMAVLVSGCAKEGSAPQGKSVSMVSPHGKAETAACICEPAARRDVIEVTVPTDLRRLPLLWRIPGDVRLVRRLNRLLEREGDKLLAEDD